VPFYEICRYTGYNDWPRNKDDIFREEQVRCQRMRDFVKRLGDGWFLFRYEEMVDKKFDAFNWIIAKNYTPKWVLSNFFENQQ
jgi:hypothetical protein